MATVATEKKTILIVEDDKNILSFLRAGLICTGYDVISASNVGEALDLLESERPDLVVLDTVMSTADGLDILQKVRNVSSLPVIAAGHEEATARTALDLGADEYISKPFLPGVLRKMIKDMLNDWPFPFCLEHPAG